jgi:hypothetical protein
MFSLPSAFAPLILAFAPVFFQRTWQHAQVLLVGAILAPGKRTVTAALRILGLGRKRRFQNYHHVLNRARWSSRTASRILLQLLVSTFVPTGPLVLGMDDTVERRRGKRIHAKGIYRDPVRSSHSHFVKASGLRWMSLMLLAEIPWAKRVWALPFLTALAPSERYSQEQKRRHKTLVDWARQMLRQVRRWLPERPLIVVMDSAFAALELLAALSNGRCRITCLTRLRLDAALYEPAPKRKPGTNGRPRKKGARLPTLKQVLENPQTRWQRLLVPHWYGEGARTVSVATGTAVWFHAGLPAVPIRWVLVRDPQKRFDPQALLCTDLQQTPLQILLWFVWRWQVEVTFEEARAHLGLETQRQWADAAIARTTPVLLALFSVVTLLGAKLVRRGRLPVRQEAWYKKPQATFSDTLARVRQQFWQERSLLGCPAETDIIKLPRAVFEALQQALCYAA